MGGGAVGGYEKPLPVEGHLLHSGGHPLEIQGLGQPRPPQQIRPQAGTAHLRRRLQFRPKVVPHQEVGAVHPLELLRVPASGIRRGRIAEAGIERIVPAQ